MEVKDIAWLAGLLEGEGCFKLHGKTNGYKGSISIALQMTDRDIIERVAQLLKSNVTGPHGPYGVSKKVTYQTSIFGGHAAGWMMTLYSFLGNRRREKIESLLNHWKGQQTVHPSREVTCGHTQRHFSKGLCRPCYMREYHKKNREAPSVSSS